MGRRLTLSCVVACLACAGSTPAPPARAAAPASVPRARDAISAADIERDLRAFADDSMLGRNAETGDAVRAARFLFY